MNQLPDQLRAELGPSFDLEREIPAGMARVFLVRDATLGRRIVVKVLEPERAGELSTERFQREIQLAASRWSRHVWRKIPSIAHSTPPPFSNSLDLKRVR